MYTQIMKYNFMFIVNIKNIYMLFEVETKVEIIDLKNLINNIYCDNFFRCTSFRFVRPSIYFFLYTIFFNFSPI